MEKLVVRECWRWPSWGEWMRNGCSGRSQDSSGKEVELKIPKEEIIMCDKSLSLPNSKSQVGYSFLSLRSWTIKRIASRRKQSRSSYSTWAELSVTPFVSFVNLTLPGTAVFYQVYTIFLRWEGMSPSLSWSLSYFLSIIWQVPPFCMPDDLIP